MNNKDIKETEELFIEKDKFRLLRIFILTILIGLLCYGIYLLYQKKFIDSKSIITEIIENKETILKSEIINSQIEKPFKYNGTINLNIEIKDQDKELTDTFNDINLNIEGQLDLKNKISDNIITTKYQDKDLIKLNFYEDNNKIYLYLYDIYDKVIEINNAIDINDNNLINQKDFLIITSSFYKAMNEIIQKNEWLKKDEEITIKDKKIKATNNYLILKDKQINDTIINIDNLLLNDEEFLKVMEKYYPDIRETLKNDIIDLQQNIEKNEITINIYTTKNIINKDIIRWEIKDQNIDTSFIIDNINNNKIITLNNKDYNLEISINNKNINLDIKINEEDFKLNIVAKFNFEEIDEVIKKDITNTIKIEEIKDEDVNTIMENISKNDNINSLMEKIMGILARNEV